MPNQPTANSSREATASEVEGILRRTEALLDGHFQLASTRHSPVYIEKFRLLQYPEHTEKLCRLIAERFRGERVQVVAGPTTGGIILSYEVARQLGVRGIFAESEAGPSTGLRTGPSTGLRTGPSTGLRTSKRRFQRGFQVAQGERVLVVDDVLTTGGSVGEVLEAVRKAGGLPVGVGVLVDRTGGQAELGVPLFACLTLALPTYAPEGCPLCKDGVPLVVT